MGTEKLSYTPEQRAAIKYPGGPLLVSAAAGSGKTRVLVERLLERVTAGGSIDEFLVITYTRAAAAELRERILDELSERLAENPGARHLRRQSLLCCAAPISTIHGFCTDILRENAHMAGLAPDFRVCDESESAIIKAAVLEDVLNAAYENIGTAEGFRLLVDTMSAGRDDARLVEIILDAHAKLQSNPDPRKWVLRQLESLELAGVDDASETPWGALLLDGVRRSAEFWRGEMQFAREEMMNLPKLEAAYAECFEAVIAGLESLLGAIERGWDAARQFCGIDFPRPRPVSGYEEIKDVRKRCKAAMERCASVFECSSEELLEDMQAVKPAVSALFELILAFDDAYAAEKRRRGVADFSDLEHLALSLLVDMETGEKTELAKSVSQRFEEILVDEYQDVNAVQELIFTAVSDGNIFMVGDVKQSIYRFRLADPSIFLRKYRSFSDADEAAPVSGGARILLSRNFRSRAGILDAVNFVFGNIMSLEFGEMDYTERERLVPGRQDGTQADPPVELRIIDMSAAEDDEDEQSVTKTQAEAAFIAGRISELVSEGPYEYSDIAILLRSVRDKARIYAAALAERGIPVDMPSGEDFFETPEISAALSILAVIDNPMQDIPLASALSCPVYSFSPDELAAIRASSRDTDFYTALVKTAERDEKCAAFLDSIEQLRLKSPDMPADRFIWHVYNETGLLGVFGAAKKGEKRRANLMELIEYARRLESGGYKGLFGFLTYIRSLEEKGASITTDAAAGAVSAVKIMSIHKSKGLEFPVVFLADTAKRLNNADAQKPLVIHPELGVGAMRMDLRRRLEYPTLARMAVQKRLTSEMMAEELRVLYVAMTRAREKLIITAAYPDAQRELLRLGKNARHGAIPPQVLEDTKSMAGWILLTALSRPESAVLLDPGAAPVKAQGAWDIRLVEAAAQKPPRSTAGAQTGRTVSALPEHVELLRERFSFEYPNESASRLPSKLTVTELKGRVFDFEAAEEAETTEPAKPREKRYVFDRPDFITERGTLTGAERGTALHLAMQYIDFKSCGSEDGIKAELDRLERERFLTGQQAAAVDTGKIAGFFESDIGRRVLRAERVEREFKFSLLYGASRFFPDGGDEKVLLQGVVDCFFEEDGELTIIDFKTDYVTESTLFDKVKRYAPQLEAYSDALERITGLRTAGRVIYFFGLGRAVAV